MCVPDSERIALVRAGDRDVFASLFADYYPGLHDYARTILGSVQAAEEVVDDVFVWVWDNRERWTPTGTIRVYLYSAVRHRALNVLRAERALDATHVAAHQQLGYVVSPPEQADAQVEAGDIETALWDVVNTLPHLARQVLTLRYRHQMSWREVAETLDLSEAAVQMHHTRAFRALRERFPRHLR